MGLRKVIAAMVLGLFASLPTIPVMAADAAQVNAIGKEFICQCGCTLVLTNCTHGECGSRDSMLTAIGQRLDQGQTPSQIMQAFVTIYGEQVLASPPKRGFNLTAWIAPFAAILLGALVVWLMLQKWVLRGRESQVPAPVETEQKNDKYWKQLDDELKGYKQGGFR